MKILSCWKEQKTACQNIGWLPRYSPLKNVIFAHGALLKRRLLYMSRSVHVDVDGDVGDVDVYFHVHDHFDVHVHVHVHVYVHVHAHVHVPVA
jgi:hypothetical protein